MNSSQPGWDFEATSSTDDDAGGDEQVHKSMAYGMSLISNEVNMTNCYKHCEHFFERFKSIHFKVLIAYWMMAGYLGDQVRSAEEAYRKGLNILLDLVYTEKILQPSNYSPGMIEFAGTSTNANCRHRGFCVTANLGFVDVLELGAIAKVLVPKDEIDGGFYVSDPISGSDQNQGLNKYVSVFNPTIGSLEAILGNAKNPSVLLIRGFQISPSDLDTLETFQSLTVLEISGSTGLTTIPPHTISSLHNLQCLNLSDLHIEELPRYFFSFLHKLRWLILRGCSRLFSISNMFIRTDLEVLDLSYCTALPNSVLEDIDRFEHLRVLDLSYTLLDALEYTVSTHNLTHLFLSGSKVENLDCFAQSNYIQVLDLSHCGCFIELNQDLLDQMTCLLKLDLSWTKVKHLPSFAKLTSLRELSLRGLELDSLEPLASLSHQLVELDLTGLKIISSSQELKLDFLQSLENLQILNLSQTSVGKLPDMSKLVRLKELLLGDCQHLKVVPDLQALTNLETLDLSLPSDSSNDNRQLEMESEGYAVPTSLRNLVLTNRFGVQKLLDVTTLGNLEFLDLRGTDVTGLDSKLQAQEPQERIPKPVEIHIVSVDDESNSQQPNQPLGFDHFEEVFIKWDALIPDIQRNLNHVMPTTSTSNVDHQPFKIMQVEMLHKDLRYIQENFEWLKNSGNWNTSKELLQELMDAATNMSSADFAIDSANFKQLLRMVVKLKLLVPHKQTNSSEALGITKKKKSPFMRRKNKENVDIADTVEDKQGLTNDLYRSYTSLSTNQKNCLLCFSAFPYNEDRNKNTGVLKSLVIKKKILTYWWVGEGFIDPLLEKNLDNEPTPNTNQNQDMLMRKEIGGGGDEENMQDSASKGVKKSKTIEEIGEKILQALAEKGFIEFVVKKGRESRSCCIHPFVHSFVIKQAKEEGFFDFDPESGTLSPHFTLSRRACLLKPLDNFPSSCKLWANYIKSPNKLESFKCVKTLFNVNESMIDIKQEWFSKMQYLYVLHLGNWRSENEYHIEVEDQKFLEDLKRMKQLRLLSLQGLPTIMKLPDSVCHLSNLLILDLKECNYLEELPPDIGSLKSLTHLDITRCPLLTKLPKGISLLSKLEVLEGFVITHQHATCDRKANKLSIIKHRMIYGMFRCKNNEACTLRDLLKLKKLRKLSITVNISKFPEDKDLKVFKEMKKLCKLKILWERSICTEDIGTATGQELLMGQNIEKLELWCFPYENAPYWLNPRELKNLKKLYIVGGNLRRFHGIDTDENRWNVETLRLKYLRNLGIQWPELKIMFPRLMYLEKHQCDHLAIFPCGDDGVWRSTS